MLPRTSSGSGCPPPPAPVPPVAPISPPPVDALRTGYFGDVTRTVVRGRASEFVRGMFFAVVEAQACAMAAEGYARTASQLVSALTPGKAKELKTGDADSLLQLIRKKNELFFHRWRPANWTYLFGFRKQEQGQNSVEIPKFDPLIAEWDARIAKLRDLRKQDPATVAEVSTCRNSRLLRLMISVGLCSGDQKARTSGLFGSY